MLISVTEAAKCLGLRSRNSIYRKVKLGELATVPGPDGKPLVEREGLEERWAAITRQRSDSPRPVRDRKPRELRPAADRKRSQPVAADAPAVVMRTAEVIPEYNESRAKSEYEKSLLLELDRRAREGQLVERKAVEATWAQVVTAAKTKLLAVPSRAKQRIPHLSLEEVEIIGGLVREALEDLSNG